MNAIERALRDFLSARPSDVGVAVVGGIAVSVRTEPRFTRDLDLAVATRSDADAEAYLLALRNAGYELTTALERTAPARLSTARMRLQGKGPIVDLLFAASGIEPEVVADAEPIEIVRGVSAPVARVGHLVAMKLVSREDTIRPRDREDLVQLAAAADPEEWVRAERAIELIIQRGFTRGRDLRAELAAWRDRGGS